MTITHNFIFDNYADADTALAVLFRADILASAIANVILVSDANYVRARKIIENIGA